MKPRRLLPFTAAITCVLTISAHSADRIKQDNITALNLAGAWDTLPATDGSDVAVWNSTVTASQVAGSNTITALGGNLSWKGIKITNVAGTANPSATTAGIQITDTTSANTLTLGTSGIDMSAATQALMIQSKVTLAGNQTWNIANANTQGNPFGGSGINAGLSDDLLLWAQAGNTALNLGGFTLGTSGAGSIGISSGYAITNGTLNINNTGGTWIQSGNSRATSLASSVTVSVGTNATLRLRSNSGGLSSAAPIGVSGSGAKLQLEINNSGTTMAQSGALTFGTGTTFENILSQPGGMTIGAISATGAVAWNVYGTAAAMTNGVAVSGALTGSGTITYANTATHTIPALPALPVPHNNQVRLSGDNSAFNGTFNINGASGNRSLRLTSATAGSALATWAPAANNILQVDGVAVNLGTLNGAGTVTNSHATNVAKITVGAGSFSGAITNGAPANGMALTKTGSGTLTLSGANTYTGLTDVQGGTLTTTTAQTGGGVVTVADSATFGVTQLSGGSTFTASALTLGSSTGSNLALTGSAAPSAAILTAPSFTVNGASKIILKGTPVDNMTLVDYTGTIGGAGIGGLTLVTPIRTTGTLFHDTTNTLLQLAGFSSDTLKWQGNVSNLWDVDATNTGAGSGATANWKTTASPSGAYYVQAGEGLIDAPVFDDTATGVTAVTLNATVSPNSVTFANSTKNYSITGSGTIAGQTGIVKSGSGSLTLGTANTFSGGVQLNDGTLNVNHANALGTGALTIAGGTTLDNTSGSAKVAANAQNWNGDFTFTGSNDLTLGSAAMDASRQVTVNGGTLTVGSVSGTGFSLTKAGAGNLTISGSATYTGGTSLNAGGLKLVNTTTGSTNFVTNGNLEFNLTTANKTLNGGTISGTGNLVKSGTSALVLGANTSPQTVALTGENSVIDVQGGVMRNDYYNSAWGGNKAGLNVASGAIFDVWDGTTTVDELNGSGTINKGWSVNITLTIGVNNGSGNFSGVILNNANLGYGGSTGGLLSLVKQGTGTQTLSGVNTYAGATTINGGTLILGALGSIDNTSGVSLGTSGTFDVSAKSGGYTVSNLSGSGTVKGALTVSTQLAIGNSPGTATLDGDLILDSATYIYEMTGGASPGLGSADLGNITGTLTITAGSILDLVELGTYTVGNKFTLFSYTTLSGAFDGLADGAEFNDDLANKWQIDYNDTTAGLNGGNGATFITITAVPEPAAVVLGAFGLLALLRRRRID